MTSPSSSKRPAHRPRKFNRSKLLKEFAEYIDAMPVPIVAEFAYTHGFGKSLIYEWAGDENDPTAAGFLNLIKLCTSKKEAALEHEGLMGTVNVTMAIFSLKQLGWSDKQETTHKGDPAAPIVISPTAAGW